MDALPKIEFDENLSEDLLNEEVSSCSIRRSEKILLNMSKNSLSSKKKRNNSLEKSSTILKFPDCDGGSPSLELKLNEIGDSNNCKTKSQPISKVKEKKSNFSLKQEISALLKYAARIREKKMLKDSGSNKVSKEDSKSISDELPSLRHIKLEGMDPS
ncbi:unnamed protein product [Moneuplotes crassus]|uniref:Uncharacterized protein n=1 Tax=Euplotes crassus TaxID=5936 RepID=A0AAD1XCB8_EUPCR|nr:unnamed protein product [Moneuplotes crassus]